MTEDENTAIAELLSRHIENGATLEEAARSVRADTPNLSAVSLAQALVAACLISPDLSGEGPISGGAIFNSVSSPVGGSIFDLASDPVADAIRIAGALVAAGYGMNEIAASLVAPGVYPDLTAFQVGTVLMAPSVFPSITEIQMRPALAAANFSQADIDSAILLLFPHVSVGGVIHYQLQAGQPLPDVWKVGPNPQGPAVVAQDNFLHYSVSNQPGYNEWLTVSTSTQLATAKGCVIAFNVRANSIQGSGEVKFTVAGDAILRFTDGGQTVKWQRWDNNFYDLAVSSIKPNGVWHQVILVITPGAITLFEDGKRLFSWQHPIGDIVNPRFDLQQLTIGASLSFDVGDIYAIPSTFATDNSTPCDYVFLKNTPPPELTFSTDGGLQISYEDQFARVSGLPLQRINSWCFLKISPNSPAGSILMYPIRVNQSQGYETKITLPGDNILRMLGNGADSNWQLYDAGGNFQTLASSGIHPGQADFTVVTIIVAATSITLFENGNFAYDRSYSPSLLCNPGIAFQHYDLNNVSVDLGGIRTLPSTKTQPITDGAVITFQCMGTNVNPDHIWLDGRTADGSVGLAPSTSGPFTGTQWRAHAQGGNVFTFECLGANVNPNHVWLDGQTVGGTVTLAPNTADPYTGTKWDVTNQGNDIYTLECLGNIVNPDHVWLNGGTGDGSVTLAPATTGEFTGTFWRALISS